MSKRRKPKFEYAGINEKGEHVYTECNGTGVVTARLSPPGKPAGLGKRLAEISPMQDGVHYSIDPLDGSDLRGDSDGPAQVANDAYRSGWDRIFAGKSSGPAN